MIASSRVCVPWMIFELVEDRVNLFGLLPHYRVQKRVYTCVCVCALMQIHVRHMRSFGHKVECNSCQASLPQSMLILSFDPSLAAQDSQSHWLQLPSNCHSLLLPSTIAAVAVAAAAVGAAHQTQSKLSFSPGEMVYLHTINRSRFLLPPFSAPLGKPKLERILDRNLL